MKTEIDSPTDEPRVRATAWALGQLTPEETAAFENEMAANPGLAAYAREMLGFCSIVSQELLPHYDEASLPEPRRASLVSALSAQAKPRPFLQRHWQGIALTAAAASIVLSLNPQWLIRNQPNHVEPLLTIAEPVPTITKPILAADTSAPVTIRPTMPKPLFVGTPLPQGDAIPNLDHSKIPILEVSVPAGTTLISAGKPVTSNDSAPIGELSLITDGDKFGDDGYFVDLMPGKTWVQIDLGSSHEIHLLWVWHFHKQNVIFNDVVAQISDDPTFQTSTTVFNNDYDNSSGLGVGKDLSYIETNNGRPMPVNGVKGRYVRFCSNGRDLDDTNQYIEVEVYGRPSVNDTLLLASNSPDALKDAASGDEKYPIVDPRSPTQTDAPVTETEGFAMPAGGPVAVTEPQAQASDAKPATVRPIMPKPLFVGTPLPLRGLAVPKELAKVDELQTKVNQAPELRKQRIDSRYRFKWASQPGATRTFFLSEAQTQERDRLPESTRDLDTGFASNSESYKNLPQNPFHDVTADPLSTFSIDVDTASYANVRRFLNEGQRPPAEAVRLEELVNYFPYEAAPPDDGKPFAVKVDVTATPWNPAHRLARVSLKGKEMATAQRPPSNLVFLVDVSGSMNEPNKLPLVQQSLRLLTERLTENDRVSLVTYAGSSGIVLPSTNGQEKLRIQAAIDGLSSGGSTNGAGGITAAYQQAAAHFIKDGVNRVILATDGDFNVGASSHDDLLALISEKAKTGVFLSVLGYGRGNLKDDTMELLADEGNGNYGYIDSLSEARKTLAEQMSGTLVTIAKDVKIQIEFNPAAVKSYRLLGYENRLLAKEDFNDDKKDAGEIGAGHNVTALYEIVPVGAPDATPVPVVDGLKYQQVPAVATPKAEPSPAALNGEMMNVKLRWKQPAGDTSELLEVPVKDSNTPLDQAGQETRWAAAVAGFAQLLRGDAPPALTWDIVRQLARSAKGPDALGYRGEFLQLIDKAESLCR
jgi:secreted protein with Ig-like and vWFA domain